jgi:hypothetical protein
VVLAFCFRRWHSVHDIVALLSFGVCIASDGAKRRRKRYQKRETTISGRM